MNKEELEYTIKSIKDDIKEYYKQIEILTQELEILKKVLKDI